jgi:TonB family protein
MLNAHVNRRPLTCGTRAATIVVLLALTVPVALVAQNRFSTIRGTVTDQTNRFLPDTRLVLTNTSTKAKYEVRTDSTGHFEFVGLQNGDYQLEVGQAGFATFKDTVAITGADVKRDVQLQVGSLEETITVATTPQGPPDPERLKKNQQAREKVEAFRKRNAERCASGAPAGEMGGNILAPLKLVDVRPVYPERLKAAGIGGVVTMEALIGTDGAVRDVKVLSSPDPELDTSALDAVRQWQFSTTYLNCTPIEVRMKVTTNFVVR